MIDRINQALKTVTPLYGIVSAVLYGVLYLAYTQYYSSFGISLDEVGIAKTDLLSEALVGPAVMSLGLAIYWGGFMLLFFALGALVLFLIPPLRRKSSEEDHGSSAKQIRQTMKEAAKALLYPSLGFGILMAISFIFLAALSEDNRVQEDGARVRPVALEVLGLRVPLLDIQAYPASITWKDTNKVPPLFKPNSSGCMMYLGRGGDSTVLYDVNSHHTIRFPSSDAVVEVHLKEENVAKSCMARTL
jgi:hypothetical protein